MNDVILANRYSHSAAETEQLAACIGQNVRGGEIIELVSDLGGGKTTFMRGLARGTGSADVVASPTFTISRVYTAPQFEIHHFDFYRLADAGLVGNELAELVGDPHNVIVLEWADAARAAVPMEHLTITIDRMPNAEANRRLHLACPREFSYLLENI